MSLSISYCGDRDACKNDIRRVMEFMTQIEKEFEDEYSSTSLALAGAGRARIISGGQLGSVLVVNEPTDKRPGLSPVVSSSTQ